MGIGEVRSKIANLIDVSETKNLVEEIISEYGKIDVLINNISVDVADSSYDFMSSPLSCHSTTVAGLGARERCQHKQPRTYV